MGRRRSESSSSGGTMRVLTTQQRSIPIAAIAPKCLKARKSVTRSDRYEAAAATAAMTVGCHVRRTEVSQGLGRGRAPPALLEVPGLIEDPDVDPVARDDADEKAGREVEVPDEYLREPERPDEADANRDAHHQERAQAHEVKEHRRQDQPDALGAHVEQVLADPIVLDEPGRHVARVPDPHLRVRRVRGLHGVDDPLHLLERRARPGQVAPGDRRTHGHHEAGPVLAGVVALRVVVVLHARGVGVLLEALLNLLDRHRRAVVVEQLVGLLGDLVVPARVDVAAQLLELGDAEKKAGAGREEGVRRLRAVLGARDDVRAELEHAPGDGVAHGAQDRRVLGLEQDQQSLCTRRARLDPVKLLDARLAVGQKRVVTGAELEAGGKKAQDAGHHGDAEEWDPGTPDLQLAKTLYELSDHSIPRPATPVEETGGNIQRSLPTCATSPTCCMRGTCERGSQSARPA